MGNAVKVGDIGTAHDGFHPSPILAGSGTVKVDGVPAARKGILLLFIVNLNIRHTREPFLRDRTLCLWMGSRRREVEMRLDVEVKFKVVERLILVRGSAFIMIVMKINYKKNRFMSYFVKL